MSTPGADTGTADPGPRIEGGGRVAVDTEALARAGHALAVAGTDLGGLRQRTLLVSWSAADVAVRGRLEEAAALLARAAEEADRAADAVRTAATRYGAAEQTAIGVQRTVWAIGAAAVGDAARNALVLGPVGPLLVIGAVAGVGGLVAAVESVDRWIRTGELQPQLDPFLIDGLRLSLSSLDDAMRAFLLLERPEDLTRDDPRALLGSATTAAVLSALLLRPAGGPLRVVPTGSRPVGRPQDLAELVERIPQGEEPAGQVRIERYDGADGPRFIVYSAGTVTFAPDGGKEPFDLASNVLGVAGTPTDAQRSITTAMTEAGVGPDDPVLLVGYSQGAINAVRVAESGGYRVGGVVEFGGPTGQIVLPDGVPVVAVEHDEDLVPALGGLAAAGTAGAGRVVVRRSLPLGGASPGALPFTAGFTAHDRTAYADTVRRAEATGDPALLAARARIDGFLHGADGTATRYHAERVEPVQRREGVSPARVPTAAEGRDPRRTR